MVDRCFGEGQYYGVDLLRRTVDEIILAIAVAHGLTSIRVAQYLTIALYTHWIILHRTDAVWI